MKKRWAVLGAVAYGARKVGRELRKQNLTGKVVLVTGGARGLGLNIARQFLKEGSRVAVCARDPNELERAQLDLERYGTVYVHMCDVTDRAAVEATVRAVSSRLGRVDILVNNAGVAHAAPLADASVGDFERAMSVNFWGAFNVIWAVLPAMKAEGGGHIVNIASIGGKVAVPHLLPYDCAKFALVGLSEGLYAELGPHKIDVTTVLPGLARSGQPDPSPKMGAVGELASLFAADAFGLTSASSEAAAREVVEATKYRDVEVVLGWQAKGVRLAYDLFPSAARRAKRWANRLVPRGHDA